MNLKNGETIREFSWINQSGITVNAKFRRMVSLADEHVMAASVDLTIDREATVSIETGVDGSVTNSGAQHFEDLKRRIYDGREIQYLSKTTQSGVWIAEHAACKINVPADVLPVMERRTLNNRYTAKLAAGEALHFVKIFRSTFFQRYGL